MDTHSPSIPGLLEQGSRLGRYEIVKLIGSGGMGAVYEGRHVDLQKRVAIKALHPMVGMNAEVLQRFVREGQAASRIRHPNAVDVVDVGSENGRAYLVMEFLEGENLSSRIEKRGAMSPEEIADVMLPVMAALNAAHREGIVHRDLKPDNIFLARTRDGLIQPKVVDFGISKINEPTGATGPSSPLTGTASIFGTPNYMSPEQLKSTKNVGPASDQYALGTILYECCTGTRAFDGETVFAIFEAVMTSNYKRPRELKPGLPDAFEAMTLKAMALTPEKRYPSVSALARELLKYAKRQTKETWEPIFRDEVAGELVQANTTFATKTDTLSSASGEIPKNPTITSAPTGSKRIVSIVAGVGAIALVGIVAVVMRSGGGSGTHASASQVAPTAAPASASATHAAAAPTPPAVAAPVPVAPPVAPAPTVAAQPVPAAPAQAPAADSNTATAHPANANHHSDSQPHTTTHAAHSHHGGSGGASGTNAMPY